MKPANDLAVDLIASEPHVAQPTHISFDERGRMWVAQYRQYPYPAGVKMISRDKYYRSRFDRVPPAPPQHDRGRDMITVHEDTDGDGTFDKHNVVLDGLNMANAALRGHGGIWVMHTPYLLFYPDANGDDVPDRDPEVRLAGFGLEDTHSVANGLVWGPDGWLYGAQGSTTTSRVVRPGRRSAGLRGRLSRRLHGLALSSRKRRSTRSSPRAAAMCSSWNSTPRAACIPATTAATRAAGITCRAGSS